MECRSSICLWVRQISASPAVAPLNDVPRVVQRLDQLQIHFRSNILYTDDHLWKDKSICQLHRSGWQVTSYAYFEDNEKHRNRSRSDYWLDFRFLRRKHVITEGFRTGIQVVPGRQHNGQHLVRNLSHMHYKSCVMVACRLHVRSTQGTKWEWRHMDHDRNKVHSNQKTDIDHALWWKRKQRHSLKLGKKRREMMMMLLLL